MEHKSKQLHAIISGAIFDFAGFLTTREKVIEIGSSANAAPVADLVSEWLEKRGVSMDDAMVQTWSESLYPKATPNSVEQIRTAFEEVCLPSFELHPERGCRYPDGTYVTPVIEDHWQTFQEGWEAALKPTNS